MDLEESVKVRLYIVEENSHTEIPDLYSVENILWHDEKPVYFTSKILADTYKDRRTESLINEGNVEFQPGEFYNKRSNNSMHNIRVLQKKVSKERILNVGGKTYFFDKKDNKMYRISDGITSGGVK